MLMRWVYDLGVKFWKRKAVGGEEISMPVVGIGHSLVKTVGADRVLTGGDY